MYFDNSIGSQCETFTGRHIVSAASSKNRIAGALQHHVLSFAGKMMAADANQLRDLHKFLRAGDEDSARGLIVNLNPSTVVNAENVDLAELPKDVLGSSLIPDIDEPGHRIAVHARGNGNCLYNSTSLCLSGDESRSTALLLLVASELYFNAEYYATHEAFKRTAELMNIPESVLVPVALTASGDKAITDGGTKIDAVKAEAVDTCEDKKWGSLIHMMAIASVIGRPVYSLCPQVIFRYRPLMMNFLKPRISHSSDAFDEPVYFLWSRDGNLDNQPILGTPQSTSFQLSLFPMRIMKIALRCLLPKALAQSRALSSHF